MLTAKQVANCWSKDGISSYRHIDQLCRIRNRPFPANYQGAAKGKGSAKEQTESVLEIGDVTSIAEDTSHSNELLGLLDMLCETGNYLNKADAKAAVKNGQTKRLYWS